MSYEVTASRKRPRVFGEMVGQEFVVATLRASIQQGRIAHAYLFGGPRGVGKTTTARILAKALNCRQGATDTPCGECDACREISQGVSLDVIEIDGASNTSVNDVREIKYEVLFSPNSCRYKIYIIDEVHMLSNSAFNALLKTIEEPPPYIVFIFATTEIHKVPATIRSRCQQFNFRLLGIRDIREKLREVSEEMKVAAEEEALLWIARESTGSLRDAYTLLDQAMSFSQGRITLAKLKEKLGIVGVDELNELFRSLVDGESRKALELAAEILARGVAVEQFVVNLVEYFRNILFLLNGIETEEILGFSARSFPEDLVGSLTQHQVERGLELLLDLYRKLRFSLNQRFELELAVSRLARLGSLITPEEIRAGIRSLRTGVPEAPGASTESTEEPVAESGNRGELKEMLIGALRRKRPTLASALAKAAAWSLHQGKLTIVFKGDDKFSSELVLKESAMVCRAAAEATGGPIQLSVVQREEARPERGNPGLDEQVQMVKKIFKGEIVQGD